MKDADEQYKLRKKLNYKYGDRILVIRFDKVKDIVLYLKDFEVNLEILKDNNPRERKPTEDKNKGKGSKDKDSKAATATVTVSLPKQSSQPAKVKQYKDQSKVPLKYQKLSFLTPDERERYKRKARYYRCREKGYIANETHKYKLSLLGKRTTINNNTTEAADKDAGKVDTTI